MRVPSTRWGRFVEAHRAGYTPGMSYSRDGSASEGSGWQPLPFLLLRGCPANANPRPVEAERVWRKIE